MLDAYVDDKIYIRMARLRAAPSGTRPVAPRDGDTIVHGLVLARSAYETPANDEAAMVFGTFDRVDDEVERVASFEADQRLLPGRRTRF